MNDLLKYYVALQSFFREVMGEWQLWDWLYNFDGDFQAPIVDIFELGDLNELEAEFPFKIDGVLRIPRTIDDSSPEAQKRSLWGMVDGLLGVFRRANKWEARIELSDNQFQCYAGATPTEAILKALCAQWGVEVEG